jgi:hypothetical protein
MRPRLIRRFLLYGLLGLVTSVAVAWGLSVQFQLRLPPVRRVGVGVAVADDIIARMVVYRWSTIRSEAWMLTDSSMERPWRESRQRDAERIQAMGGAAYDRMWGAGVSWRSLPPDSSGTSRRPSEYRVDDLAGRWPRSVAAQIANGSTTIRRTTAGWPLPALAGIHRRDLVYSDFNHSGEATSSDTRDSGRSVIEISWNSLPAGSIAARAGGIALPIQPRPGLAINTVFYALLWFLLLLIPRAIRRAHRRARGCCPRCGYSLRGQPGPGCPECGAGRKEVATWPSGEVAK